MIMLLVITIIVIAAVVIALLAWGLRALVRRWLHDDLRNVAKLLVGLLVLQFVLGMAANLFQTIPTDKPWLVFHEFGAILLHTVNATVILILAIIFRILSARKKRLEKPASLGGTAVAVAYLCGIVFVNAGQNDIFSFIMALGFITAIIAYCYAAFAR